jgi:predicted anti-sigma-YlaC factor YlaD
MNCTHCEERLSDYLEGSVDGAERDALDVHLQSCSACAGLLSNMRDVMAWGRHFPVYDVPAWLPLRILANTPQLAREHWTDTLVAAWRCMTQPRVAMGLFTATLVLGWLGSLAGISPNWNSVVRNPAGIYYEAQGAMNRAYGEAIRRYYRSPIVNEIKTRIEQLREIS